MDEQTRRTTVEDRTGIAEDERQAPIRADIERWEGELAAAVAERDEAERVLGIRRGEGWMPPTADEKIAANRVMEGIPAKIGRALHNIQLQESHLLRPKWQEKEPNS